jgi:hypothetical protein
MAKHRGQGGRGNVPYHPRAPRRTLAEVLGCSTMLGVPVAAVVALFVVLRRR